MPSFNFTIAPFNGPQVTSYQLAKSQAVRFQLDISVPPDSVNQLVVSFASPVNQSGSMEISDVNILSIGQNIPCIMRDNYTFTVASR